MRLILLPFCCLVLLAQADSPDILALQAKLAANPASDEARAALMDAYSKAHDSLDYVQQVMYLIQNKPESQILAAKGKLNPNGGPLNSAVDYQQAKSEWDAQLEKNPKSAMVAYNAAVFLTPSDPARAIDLLETARNLSPGHPEFAAAEGTAYLMAFKSNPMLSQEAATALRNRLELSSDAELLSEAGKVIATDPPDPKLKKEGLRLMQNAVNRDYRNPKWRAALDDMEQESGTSGDMKWRAIKIGSNVAEANLIKKVDPAYPILAKSGRVEGVVELTILIAPDGTVQSADTVSGPPLLVSAAKDAVLQWTYQPTLLNGMPVPVSTNVSVTFTLSH